MLGETHTPEQARDPLGQLAPPPLPACATLPAWPPLPALAAEVPAEPKPALPPELMVPPLPPLGLLTEGPPVSPGDALQAPTASAVHPSRSERNAKFFDQFTGRSRFIDASQRAPASTKAATGELTCMTGFLRVTAHLSSQVPGAFSGSAKA